jgi:acylphosphatase
VAVRRHVYYSGDVQGVGFRHVATSVARGWAVTGWVRNLVDGRVEILAEGDEADVAGFLAEVAEAMNGYIRDVRILEEAAAGEFSAFRVTF